MTITVDFDVFPSTTAYVKNRVRFENESTVDHEYKFSKDLTTYGRVGGTLNTISKLLVRDNGDIFVRKSGSSTYGGSYIGGSLVYKYDSTTDTLTEYQHVYNEYYSGLSDDFSLTADGGTLFTAINWSSMVYTTNADTLAYLYGYTIADDFNSPYPNAITTTITGNIWIGVNPYFQSHKDDDSMHKIVCSFASSGGSTLLYETGEFGTTESRFLWISDIATDSNDNLYVVDTGNNKILKYDYDGTFATAIFPTYTPASIAIDWASDTVYILDNTAKKVYVCDEFGTATNAWDLYYKHPDLDHNSDMENFTDITVQRGTGRVYVSVYFGAILIFNKDGTLYDTIENPNDVTNIIYCSNGVAVNELNHLHICDERNDRILVIDSTTDTYIRSVCNITYPQDVAFDSSNNMYVIYLVSGSTIYLSKYDFEYNLLWSVTAADMTYSSNYDNIGVCCYGNYVYVSGSDSQYVHKFTTDGVFTTKYTLSIDVGRISVDTTGKFYISSFSGNGVYIYTNDFVLSSSISSTQAWGIHVDKNNYVYFTSGAGSGVIICNPSYSTISYIGGIGGYGNQITTDKNGNVIIGYAGNTLYNYTDCKTIKYDLITNINQLSTSWLLNSNIMSSSATDYVDTWYNNVYVYDNVTLTITRPTTGTSFSKIKTITILEKPNKVTFTNNTSETADEFFWNFDDGSVADTENVTHIYQYPGTYTVTLYASNQDNYGEFSTTLEVPTPVPFAVYEVNVPDGYTVPSRVEFIPIIGVDNTRTESFDSIEWLIDDKIYHELYPKIPFLVGGEKTITVQVRNNFGEYSEPYSGTITLYDDNLRANFKPSYLNIITTEFPTSVQFTNLSSNTIGTTDYLWSFGDGETSTDENPLHEYATFGNYTVSLTVTNLYDTDTKTYTNCINIMRKTMHISNSVDSYEYGTTSGFDIETLNEFASYSDSFIRANVIEENVTFIQQETPGEVGVDEVGVRSFYTQVNELGQRIYNSLTEFGRRVIKYPVMLKTSGFSFIRAKIIKEGVNAVDDFEKQP